MAYQPKSYRKFLAGAAAVAVVAPVVAPAALAATSFSDVEGTRYVEAVSALSEAGIVKGNLDGTFAPYSDITRGEASIIVARALGLLDGKNIPANPFSDVGEKSAAYEAISKLSAAGIVGGYDADTFGPYDNITRGQMAKIITEALNLELGDGETTFTDVSTTGTFAKHVDAIVEAGIASGKADGTFGYSENILRGDFAVMVNNALNLEEVAPKVAGVSAINGKEIQVTFNQAIDAATLKDAGKADVITLVAGQGAKNDGTVTQGLSADGKVLTLKTTTFFKGDYTVKVPFEIVEGVNGQFVGPVNQKVTVNDTAAPVLSSAKATVKDTKDNIQLVTLTFNEEVSSIDNVKIGGVNYTPVVVGKNATVAVDLDGTKSYDVTVVNAQDAAGNEKDVQVAPLSVTVDNVAPSITKVEATGENTLKVTVDEALKNDALTITGKVGTFTANVVTSAVVNPTNNKEYTVTLDSDYLFKNGNSNTVTLTVAKDALADTLGNANAAAITKTAVVSKDAAGPNVVQVDTTADANGKVTAFTVTYNEEVATPDTTKVSVVNAKGEILSFADVVATAKVSAADAKKVVFTLKTAAAADKYGFDFAEGFVVDTALTPNKSAENAFTVDVNDATVPVTNNFTITDATAVNNVITVDFGTKVKATGTGSALNPASYQVNGTVLPSNTEIAFVKDANGVVNQNQVAITLPADFIKASDDKAIFRVTGVQNLGSKVNNSFIAQVTVTDNTAPVATSFVATDLKELTVTYSETVALTAGADVTDEIQLFNSAGASVAITGSKVVGGKLVLTVADAAAVSKLTTVKTAATADIADLAGVAQKNSVTVNK